MEQITIIKSIPFAQRRMLIEALWITAFAALTALGAQIEVPHQPVPYTLQTFFVVLSGAFLGQRNGALSQLVYLALGAIGVPVFSGWSFGLARLLGPTGGYLLSFPAAAFVVGYLVHGEHGFVHTLVAMVAGVFVIFSLGTIQLNFVYFHNWSDALASGFALFSWWDGLKIIAASAIASKLHRGKTALEQ